MPIIDFYQQCEDAVKAILQSKLPKRFPADKPWQLTDSEFDFGRGADHFVLFRPGQIPPPTDVLQGGEKLEMHWLITCNVALRYIEKKLQWSQFKEFRGEVWYVLADPHNTITLNNFIWRVLSVTSSEDPSYWDFSDAIQSKNTNFMLQPLIVTVRQHVVFE